MGGISGFVDEFAEQRLESQARSAEMGVIGALIGNSIRSLYDLLEPEMFATAPLNLVYRACKELYAEGKATDIITISGKLGNDYKQDMAACVDFAPNLSRERAESYACIVRENWRKRLLYAQLTEAAGMALENGVLAKDIVPKLEEIVSLQVKLEQTVTDDSAKSMTACLSEFLCGLQRKPDAIKTGFRDLDYLTGGLRRKGLYVVSARPGSGKTDFCLHLAANMSKAVRVNYNTMEMPAEQCVERIISRLTGINSAFIRDRSLTEADYANIARVSGMIYNIPLIIDEQTAITASEVKGKILKHHPDIIFLDSLQLMESLATKKTLWEEISETTRMLKQIALKHNVVIVLLVQESREGGKDKAPTLNGLKGSSSIESDADGVLFIRNKPVEQILQGGDFIETEIYLVKNRHGGTGVCKFHWQPQYHKYLAVQEDGR